MILSLKELLIVLVITWMICKFARPVGLLFATEQDFSRRRNVWCVLAIAAFLSPNFWVFTAISIPILVWIGRKDSNPGAVYLFLQFVIPAAISRRVPFVGLSYLLDLNFRLLLSLCVLAPAAWRFRKAKDGIRNRRLDLMDFLLLAYCVLTSVLYIHPEIAKGVVSEATFTDGLRRCLESFFEIYIPYFVISRTSSNRRDLLDILAAFCISCALLAAIGTFESARHWLLYGEIQARWGEIYNAYVTRGESVRAMASTGHSLVLGYLLAVAFGMWLYLKHNVKSKALRVTGTALLLCGLVAAYARGPWIGAVFIYFVFAALSPRAFSNFLKATVLGAISACIVALTPFGDKIVRVLPFLGGTVDTYNIDYRQRLLDRGWQIIQQSPFLGDQRALLKMEDLRQGEGIIDLMNGFINILLNNGFVGLSLFLLFIFTGVYKAWRLSRSVSKSDPDMSMLGASLISCIFGTLLMMWGGGLIDSMTCILVGLTAAYAHLNQPQKSNFLVPATL